MAFVQISADDDLGVVPLLRRRGRYEVPSLSAENHQTGDTYDGTFWRLGLAATRRRRAALSGRTRVTGELYVNGGELNRDVDNVLTGGTLPRDGQRRRHGPSPGPPGDLRDRVGFSRANRRASWSMDCGALRLWRRVLHLSGWRHGIGSAASGLDNSCGVSARCARDDHACLRRPILNWSRGQSPNRA